MLDQYYIVRVMIFSFLINFHLTMIIIMIMTMNLYSALFHMNNVQRRFTLLLGEIGRQHVKAPLAAAISPYMISHTHLTHA